MCNLSQTCQVWDGSCQCGSDQSCVFKPIPVPFISQSDPSVLLTLFKIINDQNEMIKQLADQTRRGLDRISALEKEIEAKDQLVSPDENLTPGKMLEILYGKNHSFTHSLSLISDVPCPAYKERAFSLMFEIVDRNETKVALPIPVNFKLMIFTTENPPKVLKVNTSGDKIIRGTVEVETNGVVLFKKVVIKEVTSHFRNGSFFVVVMPKNSQEIRPFIIENFIVKARKIITPDIKKKQKTLDPEALQTDPSHPNVSFPNPDSSSSSPVTASLPNCIPSPEI